MKSETIWINVLYFVKLKWSGLSYTLKGSFTYERFCNIMHWLFGKYWCRSVKCWHISVHNIKKITFINITIHLVRKIFRNWETFKLIDTIKKKKNLNFAWKLKISALATNTVSSPWNESLIVFGLEKNVCQIPKYQYHCVSVVLSSKKCVPLKKWLVQVSAQSQKCFSLRQPSYFS